MALGLRLFGDREPPAIVPEAAGAPRDERDVRLVVPALATSDGAGVKLHRALGSRALSMLDPFLLLDEMRSDKPEDYAAGFPTHPHRGFETVTYVIEGAADHRDSLGNHGHLGAGSAQWMTAGRGIVHSEMPTHDEKSDRLWALQLWVNLPRAPLELTHLQFETLIQAAWLGRSSEQVTQSEIARFGDIHPMQISQMLKTLESKGLIARVSSKSDRRAKHVKITAAGLSALRRALPAVIDVQSRFFGEEGRVGGSLLSALRRLDHESAKGSEPVA